MVADGAVSGYVYSHMYICTHLVAHAISALAWQRRRVNWVVAPTCIASIGLTLKQMSVQFASWHGHGRGQSKGQFWTLQYCSVRSCAGCEAHSYTLAPVSQLAGFLSRVLALDLRNC
jgi:hypothetical protein